MKLTQKSVAALLEDFRSSAPIPGGGSAAALAGAVGASLLAMVAALPKSRAASDEDLEKLRLAGERCAALARELGMKYVTIPMRGSAANPYGPKELDTFAGVMSSADGKVLLHCTIAWRASHLWAAYLIRDRKMPVATVLAQTRQINLRDDRPFGDQQPLEGFLGRPIPEMQHPKP